MTDADLIGQTLSGDAAAFGQLISRHQGAVQGQAYHALGSFEDARDVAQEAFVQAYLKLDQLRDRDRFAGWLRQVTVNCCRALRRAHKETTPLDEVHPAPADPQPTQKDLLEAEEAHRTMQRALALLSDRNRLVITLRYLGDLSYKEIARFLDVPLSTVEGRMHRAKRELRGQLMGSVENGLKDEQLPEDFAGEVLEEALERAREARKRYDNEAFVRSCEDAMEAAVRLEDGPRQVEVLSMMGGAGTSWLGKPEKGIADYELALKLAREHQSEAGKGELEVLRSLYRAHFRRGEIDRAAERARQARERSEALGEALEVALARSALDLAERLPGVWNPGEHGGYANAAVRVAASGDGVVFDDPSGVRNFTVGCPTHAAGFIYLLVPRRLFGPSLELGAVWEDEVPDKGVWPLGWNLTDSGTVLARSVVEATDDTVVTPAGRFTGCLRVRTEMGRNDGRRPREYVDRALCGTRTSWFAPGIGLVRLRHRALTEETTYVWLAEFSGDAGEALFPLQEGRWWRYRWRDDDDGFYDDLCRAVRSDDGSAYLSSATILRQPTEKERAERLAAEAELFTVEAGHKRAEGDVAGEAAAIEALLECIAPEAAKSERIGRMERLSSLYSDLGDHWHRAGIRCDLARLRDEGVDAVIAGYEEMLSVARRLGDSSKAAVALSGLGLRLMAETQYETAIRHLEEAADFASSIDDVNVAAHNVSAALLAGELAKHPGSDRVAYIRGEWRVVEKAGRLESGGSGRTSDGVGHNGGRPYPPGPRGTPMTDLAGNLAFSGIELLDAEVGESDTDFMNTGAGPHLRVETVRSLSTLVGRDERVATPAGRFEGVTLIDTVFTTSSEDTQEGPELSRVRGYFAGRGKTWHAPGVGLVRARRSHENGHATDIQLVEYEVERHNGEPLPLAIGNRWRYRWTDEASETQYEDTLRVASHREGEWCIAFVTRATAMA